jgi:two-component system, OmpR family, sensor histidine kinase KdpD
VVDEADEVQLVDQSPQALRQRLRRGLDYPPGRATQALEAFFREGNLNALRELALRKVSSTMHEDLEAYMRDYRLGRRGSACWSAWTRSRGRSI